MDSNINSFLNSFMLRSAKEQAQNLQNDVKVDIFIRLYEPA